MKIQYKFATQETVEVEVSAELGAVIVEIEHKEQNSDRRETRRHNSLDKATERSDTEIADERVDIEADYEEREEKETLAQTIAGLSEKQQRLVRLYYYEEKTLRQIADIFGVHFSNIQRQLETIHKTLKNYF